MKHIYRYSVNEGQYGGVVVAKNIGKAIDFLVVKYKDKGALKVWPRECDDYYDKNHPNVIECYGD